MTGQRVASRAGECARDRPRFTPRGMVSLPAVAVPRTSGVRMRGRPSLTARRCPLRRFLVALLAAAALVAVSAALTAATAATNNTFSIVNNGIAAYRIDGVDNPTLTVVRGGTYSFNIAAPGHPFYIKTVQSAGTGNQYTNGVTGNGTTNGTLTWVVPANAPASLFYDCSVHSGMTGEITVIDYLPGLTPVTGAILVILLAGIGLVFARRRTLLAWIAMIR